MSYMKWRFIDFEFLFRKPCLIFLPWCCGISKCLSKIFLFSHHFSCSFGRATHALPKYNHRSLFFAGKYKKDLNIRKQSKQIKQYITQKSGNAGGRLLRLLLRPHLRFPPICLAKYIFGQNVFPLPHFFLAKCIPPPFFWQNVFLYISSSWRKKTRVRNFISSPRNRL